MAWIRSQAMFWIEVPPNRQMFRDPETNYTMTVTSDPSPLGGGFSPMHDLQPLRYSLLFCAFSPWQLPIS
jgi:hypothetical protein